MGAIFWIVAGAMTGFICSKLVYKTAEKMMRDVLLGVLGALVGGVIYRQLGYPESHQLPGFSLITAIAGSVALLVVYRMLGGRASKDA
jgi:uncharacterized membrane protein YeaQ/YmgE (transglycosylase-associated protein family)